MTIAHESKNVPATISPGRKIVYGAMGAAAATASLLAGTCISRCNGCMGCLVGGTGLLGIIAGSRLVEKMSGARKGVPVSKDENINAIAEGKGGTQ